MEIANRKDRAIELTNSIRRSQDGVWDALVEIHKDMLYREMGYGTMDEWAEKEFGWTADFIRKQIRAANTRLNLSKNQDRGLDNKTKPLLLPTHERQIRPLTKLIPEKQIEAWNKAVEIANGEVPTARIVAEAVKEMTPIIESPPLPDGKYKVIYADPPWPVGSIVMDKWESPIEDKYPTMSLDEIMGLPVSELAADDCSLFLWTTHTYLPDALNVIKTWGFKYHCCITWNKGSGWTQFGFHRMTEFLLFAYKGGMEIDQYGEAIPTLINEPKTYHSKKPDLIRDLIKGKTQGPRLEMFARGQYDGWTSWGNDVNG